MLASLGTVYTVTGRGKDGLGRVVAGATEGEADRILYEHALVLVQLGEGHLEASLEEARRVRQPTTTRPSATRRGR